jgi:ABC-type sugar transport system substrate-binding protein
MADPLTKEDLASINDNLTQLSVAEDAIKRAEQAGVPVTEFKNQARDQRVQLLKLKQTYFPGE